MSLVAALSHRPFALVWSGQTVSRLGDSLYRVALVWWVLQKTGSAAAMSTVLILAFAPMLLFVLIGGVTVDRAPRVWVMFGSDLLRGVAVAALALLAASSMLEIWHVYAISLLFGFVDAFFEPAYSAVVPQITPANKLPSANSLTALSEQTTRVLGPALGAGMVGLGGIPLAFALNALSFFFSAACLLPLSTWPDSRQAQPGKSSLFADFKQGLDAVLSQPWLWITIALAAIGNVTMSAPFGVTLPFLVKDTLHAGVAVLGMLYALNSLGSVLSAVYLGRRKTLRKRGLSAYTALIGGSLTTLLVGVRLPLVGLCLLMLMNGAAMSVFSLIWTNTLQELVPAPLLGRVYSIDMVGSYALMPVGFGLIGLATDRVGAPLVFVVGGAITTGLLILALSQPAIRRLD